MVVPVIHRLTVVRVGSEPHYFASSISIFTAGKDCWGGIITPEFLAKMGGNDYIADCLMDIPKDILSLADAKIVPSMDIFKSPPQTALHRDLRKMFNVVLIGDRNSDVMVIILKTKEKHENDDEEAPAAKSPRTEEVLGQFHCHRNVLTTRTAVFDSMLDKDWKENKRAEIEIAEFDMETMEAVLRYIYTSDVLDQCADFNHLSNIISAAEMYCLDELKFHCAILLMINSGCTLERLMHLEIAEHYHLDQLKALCLSQLSMDLDIVSNAKVIEKIGMNLFTEIVRGNSMRNLMATMINL